MAEKRSSEIRTLNNAQIADRLMHLAQLLSPQKENFYRVKAYQRAAAKVRAMSESVDALVREQADLTEYAGIGEGIASVIREVVLTGTTARLEKLRSLVSQELEEITQFPRLDPRKILRIYKRMKIASLESLKEKLDRGDVEKIMGPRLAQHVRQGLSQSQEMLLYKADSLRVTVEDFLLNQCRVVRAEAVGDYRRRVEVIRTLTFIVETADFPSVIAKLQHYGGGTALLSAGTDEALFALSAGIELQVYAESTRNWGTALITRTGSEAHLKKLGAIKDSLKTLHRNEQDLYRSAGLEFIQPEMREGYDEIELARLGKLPALVSIRDLRGELHAHSLSSDGSASIEAMAMAAKSCGYEYIGMSDHSQSLKIANGVSVEDLRQQIRFIDRLNEKLEGIRILKSSEVDILADGSLDYPDDLLQQLDYTVCSIHSRFGLGKAAQTERIIRAMDNRYFNILGHATGRLLLKRPGYEIDFERVVLHAKQVGCFFEINSSPDRLDLSADHARIAMQAGVKIAITTDAHGTREFGLARYGVDQARRAGIDKKSVLNAMSWKELQPLFVR